VGSFREPDSFSCRHAELSDIVCTLIRYMTLHLGDRRGAQLCSVKEIAPKSPLESLSITFTSNGKRESVPRDQVSPLLVVYFSLFVHIN